MLDWGPSYLKKMKGATVDDTGWAILVLEFGGIPSTVLLDADNQHGISNLHLIDEDQLIGQNLGEFEKQLPFERFFRMDKAHARTRDGVGLGLSLAREIARSHEGELALVDAPPGWNAFLLTIPTIAAPAPIAGIGPRSLTPLPPGACE